MNREGKQLEQVKRELGALPKVEAPVNFEQMVRTKIAEGRPVESTGRAQLMLALKFALPTIVLMLFGAFIIFSGMKAPSYTAVAPVDERPLRPESPLSSDAGPTNQLTASANNSRETNANLKVVQPAVNGVTTDTPGGGSADSAVKGAQDIRPEGMDGVVTKIDPQNVPASRIEPATLLSMLAIQTSCNASSCSVSSVIETGAGARSGLKVGDVIEEINGQRFDDPEALKGRVIMRTLTVRRGGSKLTINLTS